MKASIKTASKLIKSYNWNSIFFRYWKKIMLIIMVPFFIINIIVFIYYNSISTNEVIRSVNYDFLQLSNSVDRLFEKSQESSTLLGANSKVNMYLTHPDMTKVNAQITSAVRDSNELMRTFKIADENIEHIRLYSFVNNYVISTSEGNFIDKYIDTEWYQHYLKNPNTDFILRTSYTNPDTLIFGYTIKSINAPLGLLIFELNTQHIRNVLRNDDYRYYSIQLLDSKGQSLLQTNDDEFEPDNLIKNIISETHSDNDVYLTKHNDTLYISSIVGTNNTLILTAKLNQFSNNRTRIIIIFLICLLIAIVSPLVLSFYISMQFYHSIEEIIIDIHKIENPQNRSEDNHNELAFISKSIINMRDENQTLEKELTLKISELKKLQSAALQMQFSPHFLFNTLNTISVVIMSITNGNNPASKTIRLLSDLLTIALNTNEYIVTIEQEILYCKKYVEIEKIKNKNSFETVWNIDEDVMNYKTAKLILQPIIENAFYHGIKYLRNDTLGQLEISAYSKDKDIIFTISDNGPGIDKEKLTQLQKNLNNNDMPGHKHIGLCNVNSRIKLIFGEQYGLSIVSKNNNTVVTIKIPKI